MFWYHSLYYNDVTTAIVLSISGTSITRCICLIVPFTYPTEDCHRRIISFRVTRPPGFARVVTGVYIYICRKNEHL